MLAKIFTVSAVIGLAFGLSAQTYWPTHQWREAKPETQGVDAQTLVQMLRYIREQRMPIHALLIVRHGYLVLDASFYPYQPAWPHDLASATKSVTSVLIGAAIQQRKLQSVHQSVLALLPQYAQLVQDPLEKQIELWNLLTMTSGLRCGLTAGGEKQLRAMQDSSDWAAFTLALPMQSAPGSEFAYCSSNCHLMSCILSAQTGESELEFARQHLFAPLGMDDARWSADPQGRTTGWGGLHLKPRDFIKLGYLYLHAGLWEHAQIVSPAWVQASISPKVQVRPGVAYGYNGWINTTHQPPIFEAVGRGGQRVSVLRDKDTVIALLGGGEDTDLLAPFS